jgi:hypothetical protein
MESTPANAAPGAPPPEQPAVKKAGWPKGKPRKAAGPSLLDAAGRAQDRQGGGAPRPGTSAAGGASPNTRCEKCGQGEGKVTCTGCGRETSPLTREATNVLADQYADAMVFLANAVGGEGYKTDPRAHAALSANAREAAWVYRAYLNENLVLVGLVATTAMVFIPAVMTRRARDAAKRKAAGAPAGEGGKASPADGKVVEIGGGPS